MVARTRGRHVLRLFVAGATDRSRQAVLRVRQFCETDLGGAWKLEVIDIYQQPALARFNQIVATPTLIKEFPRPVRRFIGSMANIAGLFVELDLITKGNPSCARVRGSAFVRLRRTRQSSGNQER